MFHYTESLGKLADTWRVLMLGWGEELCYDELLSLRKQLVALAKNVVNYNIDFTTTVGELGMLTNNQQLSFPQIFSTSEAVLHASEIRERGICENKIEEIGCFNDHARLFDKTVVVGASDGDFDADVRDNTFMSGEFCALLCLGVGEDFVYSGVEGSRGDQCRCSEKAPSADALVGREECE